MGDLDQLTPQIIPVEIAGVSMRLSAMHRDGQRAPILFLHGFGSTKEDYCDVAFHDQFAGRRLIGYDAPGFGASDCDDLSAIDIPFLKQTALAVLAHFGVERFHLVGHSMGGLTGLKLAHDLGTRVISFTNIEGNVAPEDCFLSRQIIEFDADSQQVFLDEFVRRAWSSHSYSHPLYASALVHKVQAKAVGPIFRSMVVISDSDPLLDQFTSLPCTRMFVYGDQNRDLWYLGTLMQRGIQLAEIENCGHFPMYANPTALWQRMSQFMDQSEMETSFA
jgi:pimeloyl-ACP methyl ester carboxylesterase